MIGQMSIAIALPGFNDLDPYVSFKNHILFTVILNLKSMSGARKIQDFGPREIEFCHPPKLWPLNVNLFFSDPYQLTIFT